MAEKTFENQMERLEEIVRLLEKGRGAAEREYEAVRGGDEAVRRAGQAAGQGGTESDRDAETAQGELTEQPFDAEEAAK